MHYADTSTSQYTSVVLVQSSEFYLVLVSNQAEIKTFNLALVLITKSQKGYVY